MQHYHVIEPTRSLNPSLKEIWQYRELLFYFSWRDIKVKYKETLLGIAWVALQPIVMSSLLTLIFSKGLGLVSTSLPYPIFVLSGWVLWSFVAACMNNAAASMEQNSRIIKKVYFPRLIVPISAVLTAAFDLLFGLLILAAGCLLFGVPVFLNKLLIALPLSLFLLTVAAAGLSCLFAMLNAIFKDFRYVIPFVVQVLFFSSPVFYEHRMLGEGWWSEVLAWNPFAGGIQVFRAVFSAEAFDWQAMVKPAIAAFVCAFGGVFVFKKFEPRLADLI